MQLDCPRCGEPIAIDLRSKARSFACDSCGTAYRAGDMERVAMLGKYLESVAGYVIEKYLGSGEFVDVWQAHDQSNGSHVALKLCYRDSGDRKKCLWREVKATGLLQHAGIVRSHFVRQAGEYVFSICDLVDGIGLDAWLRLQKPTPDHAAQICIAAAEAMHHAHEQGVVHRDLKPSNLLIDADRNVFVTDFGLAKIGADDSLDRYEQARYLIAHGDDKRKQRVPLLGTPAYMSPEQARGDWFRANHLSDVYSLGVILYELLAGRRPYITPQPILLREVVRGYPPPPRRLNRAVPRALEAVCLKAMSTRPEQRYPSALALAEDCRRAVAGQPTAARPLPFLSRCWGSLCRACS